MSEHIIVEEGDLDDGEHLTVLLEGREISVYHLDGEYYAYTNWCPHQSGPVCEGILSGTWDASVDSESREVTSEWTREGEILNCPWHGWEFDIETGASLSNDSRLIAHDVIVEDGDVVLTL